MLLTWDRKYKNSSLWAFFLLAAGNNRAGDWGKWSLAHTVLEDLLWNIQMARSTGSGIPVSHSGTRYIFESHQCICGISSQECKKPGVRMKSLRKNVYGKKMFKNRMSTFDGNVKLSQSQTTEISKEKNVSIILTKYTLSCLSVKT